MHSFAQNASTQSLFSILYKIMDESIERKKDVPHVCHSEYIHLLYFLSLHRYLSCWASFLLLILMHLSYCISFQYLLFIYGCLLLPFYSACSMSIDKDCTRDRMASFNSGRKLKKCKLLCNFFSPLRECFLMYCA